MDSLFAIGLGLSLRLLVDVVSQNDFRVGGSLVGLWEGIVLYHFLEKMPKSHDPYVAYGVRLFVDFLFTESLYRMGLVMLWTALGLVLSDIAPFFWYDIGLRHIIRRFRHDMVLLGVPSLPFFPKASSGSSRVRFHSPPGGSAQSQATSVPSARPTSPVTPSNASSVSTSAATPPRRKPSRVPGSFPDDWSEVTDTGSAFGLSQLPQETQNNVPADAETDESSTSSVVDPDIPTESSRSDTSSDVDPSAENPADIPEEDEHPPPEEQGDGDRTPTRTGGKMLPTPTNSAQEVHELDEIQPPHADVPVIPDGLDKWEEPEEQGSHHCPPAETISPPIADDHAAPESSTQDEPPPPAPPPYTQENLEPATAVTAVPPPPPDETAPPVPVKDTSAPANDAATPATAPPVPAKDISAPINVETTPPPDNADVPATSADDSPPIPPDSSINPTTSTDDTTPPADSPTIQVDPSHEPNRTIKPDPTKPGSPAIGQLSRLEQLRNGGGDKKDAAFRYSDSEQSQTESELSPNPQSCMQQASEFRDKAKELAKKKQAVEKERKGASENGKPLLALLKKRERQRLEEGERKLHEKAARRIYAGYNYSRDAGEISLCGLEPDEAVARIENALADLAEQPLESDISALRIDVRQTGKGSVQKTSVMKLKIIKTLNGHGIGFSESTHQSTLLIIPVPKLEI